MTPLRRPSELLTPAERAQVTQRSDLRAAWLVGSTWLAILALLVTAGLWPSVFTLLLVLLLLPGRQLSLAVLMHEAGHGSLFRSPAINRWVGQWLCALPTLSDLASYAAGHAEHHRLAGTAADPDLPNYGQYPISRDSFRRKVWRDLTGQTGAKLVLGLLGGAAGVVGDRPREGRALLVKQVAVQLLLFVLLWMLGIGWTWCLWALTFMTTFMLVIRLRQIAEHAGVPDLYDPDPRMNTRTVVAPWWQRLLLAPNNVNYHMEHHFMAGVPCYRLPALRQLLREKGFLADLPEASNYLTIFRSVLQEPAKPAS